MAIKEAAKKSTSTKSTASKNVLKKSKRSTGSGPACWPGFQRVAGTKAGAKGSCEPKEHQTAGQRKADSRAAAASKLRKAGNGDVRS